MSSCLSSPTNKTPGHERWPSAGYVHFQHAAVVVVTGATVVSWVAGGSVDG